MHFVKTHGTGNDFVVIADFEERLLLTPENVRLLCHRNFGIGADGVIRIAGDGGRTSPYFMDYRNADGSIAEMCGNGVRVVAKYLGDRNLVSDAFALDTRAGLKELVIHRGDDGKVETVRVDMGPPVGEVADEQIETLGAMFDVTLVSMGNPHVVIFVPDVETAPVDTVGPSFEYHERFPERTNVEFVAIGNDGVIRQRTWERGVGETLSCGTGTCAVTVAANRKGIATDSLAVEVKGGKLILSWQPGDSVFMTGPAIEVFEGTFNERDFGIYELGQGGQG